MIGTDKTKRHPAVHFHLRRLIAFLALTLASSCATVRPVEEVQNSEPVPPTAPLNVPKGISSVAVPPAAVLPAAEPVAVATAPGTVGVVGSVGAVTPAAPAAKGGLQVSDISVLAQIIDDDNSWIDEKRDFGIRMKKSPAPPAIPAPPKVAAAVESKSASETAKPAKAPKGAKLAKASKRQPRAPQPRLTHAKELLGSYYGQSVVQNGEQVADISSQVKIWTRNSVKIAGLKDWKKKAKLISEAILAESRKYSFDPIFIMAVIESESSFKPDTRGSAGEIGLMQILPGTAKWVCERQGWKWGGKKMLLDPVKNIRIGSAYLALLRKQFDSHSQLYLAAYNMGSTNVQRALANQTWPKEYALRVMEHYVAYYRELKKRSS